MNVAQGGFSWIICSFLLFVILSIMVLFTTGVLQYGFFFCSLLLFIIFCLLIIFFRDPQRKIGEEIVAVADGIIREITHESDNEIGRCIKISTFMNIHNVHVNRMPLSGIIKNITHYSGAHIPAFKKESEKNERVLIHIQSSIGLVKVVLIAGTLARRIVPYIHKGDTVEKGEKLGLIRLGSRVDIYLPEKAIKKIIVAVGDKVKAGEDTIATIND